MLILLIIQIIVQTMCANHEAYQNYFENIQTHDVLVSSVCIYANSDYDYNDRTIVIGNGDYTTYVGLNKFDGADIGITAAGQQNLVINKNDFGVTNRIRNMGTFIFSNDKKTIDVNLNHYNNFFIGTFLDKMGNEATVSIDSNTYETGYLTNVVDFYGSAIIALNKTLGTRTVPFTITNNYITDGRIGIHTANIDQVQIGDEDAGNIIEFNFGSTDNIPDYYAGIWTSNCTGVKIFNNEVSNSDVNTTISTTFIGIDAEVCTDGNVNCNTITNIPYSMNFYDNCDGTLLRNNSMTEYDEAVHLDNATLPDQYQVNDITSDEEPTDNIWNDAPPAAFNPTDRVTGTSAIGQFNWYYQSGTSGSNPYDPLDNNSSSNIIATVPDNVGTVACDDFSDRQSMEARFGAVVGDSMNFEENQNENAYLAKSNTFKAMEDNPQLLSQVNSNNADYLDFYNVMKQSNIGMFDSISNLSTDTTQVSNAIAINTSINDTNTIEYYKKTVLDIYLNKTAQNTLLSENDTAVCDFISSLAFLTAGDAIYIAAGLIGKEIHPSNTTGMKHWQPDATNKKNETVTDYLITPNPVTSSFIIIGNVESLREIYLMSSDGKVLKQFKPLPDKYSVTDIANGMYWLKLIDNTRKVSIIKLSIIK